MSSLLEEAIVDAAALKDAALKNAEVAVLEKYSTEVKDALSTLLEQEELGEEESAPPPGFMADVPYAFQNEELDAPPADEIIEIDFSELKARIEEEEAATPAGAPTIDLLDPEAVAGDVALQEAGAGVGYLGIKTPAEAGLEGEPSSQADIAQDTEMSDEDIEKAAVEEGADEDIAITEEMLADLIEELVVDMTPRPEGWSSEGSAYNSIIQANDEAMAAALAAHPEEEEEEEAVATAPDVVSDAELYETKISQLTESTKELYALLVMAKDQLTQLNLANAKLVYQNKALNSASLNERQKTKIVEAVQLANSVEEAKVLFETIQNAVEGVRRISRRPETLREAVQRPTSLLLSSKKNNEATRDPKMGRMLRLAGLNK